MPVVFVWLPAHLECNNDFRLVGKIKKLKIVI